MAGTSTYQVLGIPEQIGILLSTVAFILAMTPYFAGADFGALKVPALPARPRRVLRLIGPLTFIGSLILFIPAWNRPRVPPGPLIAILTMQFTRSEGAGTPPTALFNEGAELRIGVSTFGGRGLVLTGWTRQFSIGKPEIIVTSTRQLIDRKVSLSVDGGSVVQTNRFEQFAGELGVFAYPEPWKAAIIEATMEAQSHDPWLNSARRELSHDKTPDFDQFYGISSDTKDFWANTDYSVQALFPATLDLMLGSVRVAQLEGIVARVSEHDEDVRGLHVIRFKERRSK